MRRKHSNLMLYLECWPNQNALFETKYISFCLSTVNMKTSLRNHIWWLFFFLQSYLINLGRHMWRTSTSQQHSWKPLQKLYSWTPHDDVSFTFKWVNSDGHVLLTMTRTKLPHKHRSAAQQSPRFSRADSLRANLFDFSFI